MKRNLIAFFTISLFAELGTTILQGQRTVTDVTPGLYYPDFKALLLERLFFWFVIFIVLSGAWLLTSSRLKPKT
jgi:hypothetical protein